MPSYPDASQGLLPDLELNAVVERANAIQELLWQIVEQKPTGFFNQAVARLFIMTQNETIDDQASAGDLCPCHAGSAGYADGLDNRRAHLSVYVVSILVVAIIVQGRDRPDGVVLVNSRPICELPPALTLFDQQK
jgi:hypothetical protein